MAEDVLELPGQGAEFGLSLYLAESYYGLDPAVLEGLMSSFLSHTTAAPLWEPRCLSTPATATQRLRGCS